MYCAGNTGENSLAKTLESVVRLSRPRGRCRGSKRAGTSLCVCGNEGAGVEWPDDRLLARNVALLWRSCTSPTVKNDSILTSDHAWEQFEHQDNRSSASSISALEGGDGRAPSWLADRGWQKWSRACWRSSHSFIPNTLYPSNGLASVPCICLLTLRISRHRGWGSTKAIGKNRLLHWYRVTMFLWLSCNAMSLLASMASM